MKHPKDPKDEYNIQLYNLLNHSFGAVILEGRDHLYLSFYPVQPLRPQSSMLMQPEVH